MRRLGEAVALVLGILQLLLSGIALGLQPLQFGQPLPLRFQRLELLLQRFQRIELRLMFVLQNSRCSGSSGCRPPACCSR